MKYFLLLPILLNVTLFANDIIIKESAKSVDATIQKIKEIVTKKGLRVFTVVDHQANAKHIGMQMRSSKLIIFGNPKIGTQLMQQDVVTGVDLPMKILVYQDRDKKVKVAYRNGSWLKEEHPLLSDKLVQKIDNALDKITNKAIQ
ncbi:DUF302 domain-containing protein [Sulfurimonas sp. SWIR-19]|uniref:DUF302 domain-containing protein n=1 Tax=Sulfurimonas sp. SWIR-19 TaxID=2878390 RepID=UPI001CF442C3|nr:DUF302 domain-containing protein [Sulfurimonas sp. SWIR-19]UCN00704.1 DUF302 domain-containing protein [Sulfurimonas sp. SWIR-19]